MDSSQGCHHLERHHVSPHRRNALQLSDKNVYEYIWEWWAHGWIQWRSSGQQIYRRSGLAPLDYQIREYLQQFLMFFCQSLLISVRSTWIRSQWESEAKDCWRVDELWQLIVARVVAWIESYPSLPVDSLHINPIDYQRNSKVQTREFSGAKFDLCGPLLCQKVDLVHFPAPIASIGPWRRFTSSNHVTVRTWCERKLFYAWSVWGLRPPEERRRTWHTARCNPQAWLCSVICYRRRVPPPVRQGPLYSCLAYVSKWVLEGRCCW